MPHVCALCVYAKGHSSNIGIRFCFCWRCETTNASLFHLRNSCSCISYYLCELHRNISSPRPPNPLIVNTEIVAFHFYFSFNLTICLSASGSQVSFVWRERHAHEPAREVCVCWMGRRERESEREYSNMKRQLLLTIALALSRFPASLPIILARQQSARTNLSQILSAWHPLLRAEHSIQRRMVEHGVCASRVYVTTFQLTLN